MKRVPAFNLDPERPRPGDDVGRTNLYYLETDAMGRTWRNAQGRRLAVPLVEVQNEALVHDCDAEGLLAYPFNPSTTPTSANP